MAPLFLLRTHKNMLRVVDWKTRSSLTFMVMSGMGFAMASRVIRMQVLPTMLSQHTAGVHAVLSSKPFVASMLPPPYPLLHGCVQGQGGLVGDSTLLYPPAGRSFEGRASANAAAARREGIDTLSDLQYRKPRPLNIDIMGRWGQIRVDSMHA